MYVWEREGACVCSVQVSCQCCLSGAVFSLRQVMSSVTSTSAGHPMREMQRGLETAAGVKQQRVRGSPCVLEGEMGRLNHVTCTPFHLTAAPLGHSLFTLPSSLLRVLQKNSMGKQKWSWSDESGYSGGYWRWRRDRDRMRLLKGRVGKGLKTSRRGWRDGEVLKKKAEEWGIEGVCLPRSEQAVLSSSSSLCPQWLCLWPGPAVAIIRHK